MFKCSCCVIPKSFIHFKSLRRHQRKYDPSYLSWSALKEAEYLKSPKKCKECAAVIPYSAICHQYDKTFCDRSCAAKFNNRGKPSKNRRPGLKYEKDCETCGNALKNHRSRYCSLECHFEARRKSCAMKVENGEVTDRKTLKKYLIEARGWRCEICKLEEWLGEEIPLELDHINGNAGLNLPSNLRLLCPNCHAKQPTSKGGNRGFGRKSLGLKLS